MVEDGVKDWGTENKYGCYIFCTAMQERSYAMKDFPLANRIT